MMVTLRFLCLFSSEEVRRATFFAGRPGHWVTDIDAGAFEFVPLVVDGEVAALAAEAEADPSAELKAFLARRRGAPRAGGAG